ncbi:MAG: glycosyltransferase [Planctomycetes bacterium]|nr:glycosyltransferase [Planctomycetota bacterium]NOG53996.1 glycosyltransferase [Planctomycetota bacterium]
MTSLLGLVRMVVTLKPGKYLREHRERELLRQSGVFDESEYLCRYPDVATTGMDPILHYLRHGAKEGRRAHLLFDEQWYVSTYPDVAESGMSPLVHFIVHGATEGRSPCPDLDVQEYMQRHSFCRTHEVNPLAHVRLTDWFHRRHGSTASSRPATSIVPDVQPGGNGKAGRGKAVAAGAGHAVSQDQLVAARKAVGACTTQFSVIMPTWNRRKMICKSIDSVLAQTYPHFELIISDDGSTDGTREFLESHYAEGFRSGRIRWVDGPHTGVSGARNRGLAAATGDWIAYLDSDNSWRPDYLMCIAAEYISQPWRRTAYTGLRVNRGHTDQQMVFCKPFDWAQLSRQNYIDLNVFSHHRDLFAQLGGFDESLQRLVDWELIIRYTELYPPAFVNGVLADYYIYKDTDHITTTEPLQENWDKVWSKHHVARLTHGSDELRLAYVLWDFPALSQTFVISEIREMVARGFDVRVYYHKSPDEAADLDFPIEATRFRDHAQLSGHLRADKRNWIHTHFAYPALTLATYPAAKECGIPFSFMPHAVDIFHHANRKRNNIREITNDPLCRHVICYGPHHRSFLISQGVPAQKVLKSSQSFRSSVRAESRSGSAATPGGRTRIVCIGRYIEKKGIEYLIRAMSMLDRDAFEVDIYGYGPLENDYHRLIDELKVENVTVHGPFQGDEERTRIYESADLFVLPCVVAESGDVDGFPTVFLEAMAAGVPVITTTVSANADIITDGINGLLCPPRDEAALAQRIAWYRSQPAAVLARLGENAHATVKQKTGSREVVDTLLDYTARPPLDIFMVTWHPTTDSDYHRTIRIIERVFEMTLTPFKLTIVDNASHEECVAALRRVAEKHTNLRLILLPENIGCGPASNIAYQQSRSDYIIYLCSNEAFVARPGWERGLLSYMQTHPDVALAGHLIGSPKWATGAEYEAQPWFANFRNPEFATTQPKRLFRHVQGGVHIMRREALVKHGAFNEKVPNSQCDVELSYHLESCGWRIGTIPSVVSVTQRTRPTIHALVDESVDVVHPVTCEADETLVDQCVNRRIRRCNITGASVPRDDILAAPDEIVEGFNGSGIESTGRSRAIYRLIAQSHWVYRNLTVAARLSDNALIKPLQTMFRPVDIAVADGSFNPNADGGWRSQADEPVDLAIISVLDPEALCSTGKQTRWLDRLIGAHGTLVFSVRLSESTPPSCYFKTLAREYGCSCRIERPASLVNGYGLAPLFIWTRTAAD